MSEIIIKQPVSFLNRNVKFNFKNIFTSVAKTLIKSKTDLATGNVPKLTDNIADLCVDLTNAVELEVATEETAWNLIINALIGALDATTETYRNLFYKIENLENVNSDDISSQLEAKINSLEITLNADFFDSPSELAFLDDIAPIIIQWLEDLGLDNNDAQTFYRHLRGQFTLSLQDEWTKKPTLYATIKDKLTSPFTSVSRTEQRIIQYRSWLQQQVCERMFDEPFGLQDVFIPLRGYYIEKTEDDEKENRVERSKKKKCVIALDDNIDSWLNSYEIENAIKVISGGPGSGKSSFAKMLAAKMAAKNKPVLFVPLHRIKFKDYLLGALQQFVENDHYLNGTGLTDSADSKKDLLIIFDGLDELTMQGGQSQRAAENFMQELHEMLRNQKDNKWQAIVTGRQLSIQPQQLRLKGEAQTLHLLPYYLNERERKQFQDPNNLLATDARQDWWKQYARLKDLDMKRMPKALAIKSLEPVTKEPLLNYLVSLSHFRKKIKFSEKTNLNEIYADLLSSVHERKYEHKRQHIPLPLKKFEKILQEIALVVWHESGRNASMDNIIARCKKTNLKKYLEQFTEDAKSGVTRLLTAFYFREFDAHTEQTFEFTHKSFGEYLTAKRIVATLKTLTTEVERYEDDDGGCTKIEAFERWVEICGCTQIDDYLEPFLNGELELIFRDKGIDEIERYQRFLFELIKLAVEGKSPLPKVHSDTFSVHYRYNSNAEIALLLMHSICGSFTKKRMGHLHGGMKWILRLATSRDRVRVKVKANYLDLRASDADASSFYHVSFVGSDLSESNFFMSIMFFVDLMNANLSYSNLSYASVKNANLTGTDLAGTDLSVANFMGTDLKVVDFKGAYLMHADLSYADLRHANLRSVDLAYADLRHADLRHADLTDAILTHTDLTHAELTDAILTGTKARKIKKGKYIT